MSSLRLMASLFKTIRADRELRHVTDRDPKAFEQLYRAHEDPWGLRVSPFTQYRYLALLERLAAFTPCDTLLDVGCGEGLFTRYLTGVAANVVGIDLSATAIERARHTVRQADFHCIPLQDFQPTRHFDVVVAAEMLYYTHDVDRALERLCALGDVVLVSYARARASQIENRLRYVRRPSLSTFHPFFQSDTHGFTIASFGVRAGSSCSNDVAAAAVPDSVAAVVRSDAD